MTTRGARSAAHASRGRRAGGRTGGGRTRSIVISLAIVLGAVAAALALQFATILPPTVHAGDNLCLLGRYGLSERGFDVFSDIVDRSEGMPARQNVAAFEAEVDDGGNVTSFSLALDTYDDSGAYRGLARYTYGDRTLVYEPPRPESSDLVRTENPNSELDYLGQQVRTIPLARQIALGGLARNVVRFQPHTLVDEGTPIFDGRGGTPFEALSAQDYNAGLGGVSDGNTNVVFRLYDGQSVVEGQQYLYVFDPLEPESAVGDQVAYMACDYAITNGNLRFTRDHGQSWIETDLLQSELNDTLDFYQNGLVLPPSSMFVSTDDSLPLAYFYGGNPQLKVSADQGATWETIPFPTAAEFGRSVTRRAVGFATPQFGYAALGTDWSMGGGEHKACFFTDDGGATWTEKALPLTLTSNTLLDMAMADESNGVVALDAGAESYFPLLYATADTGDTWEEIRLPYDQLPQNVASLSVVDSLTHEDGTFTLVLGQGDAGTVRATFSAPAIDGPWEFVETSEAPVHTVG